MHFKQRGNSTLCAFVSRKCQLTYFRVPFPVHCLATYASPNASVLCRVVLWHSTGREMGDAAAIFVAGEQRGVVSQGCCSVCSNPRPTVPLFAHCSIHKGMVCVCPDAALMRHCVLFALQKGLNGVGIGVDVDVDAALPLYLWGWAVRRPDMGKQPNSG
ncbi:uncharacterized protein LY79DRAFT_45620 [Colletotrichum navitas]|uniref:Uncharacterized protein n=1 Tax=Colletotrichum navitas TaxID=681940 RepID=A0AAD8PMT2_9PEZI|nr:uncharacterized protein LY79DRAFT_45620 [Colletotrichum navitas]KAK1570277.1 hypothetical protein LY79DRAFT_45620 [Colletotrichum navitas]